MKKIFFLFLLAFISLVVNATVEIGGIYYGLYAGETAGVSSNPNKYSGKVVIPKSITYNGKTYRVIGIEENAFRGCSDLTSVTIPNSIKSIIDYSFRDCTGLTSIIIGSGVTFIGALAFDNCISLTSVTIPNLSEVAAAWPPSPSPIA